MKRFNTLSTLFLFAMAIHAQVELTIETAPGELKNVLSEEQRQTVTDLTLTGSMNDSDFYTIRDGMPELKILDMRKVEVDSIPVKAFYETDFDKCTLPESLIYIGDSAFNSYDLDEYIKEIYITGRFPALGFTTFCRDSHVNLSDDNIYCKQDEQMGHIYSINGKIFYYSQYHNVKVTEGIEIIESHAFDNTYISRISIPSTLKLIKKFAFRNIRELIPQGMYEPSIVNFISYAKIPPTLEEHAFEFNESSRFVLIVPQGKVEIYKNADPQWSKFPSIADIAGITNPKENLYPLTIAMDTEIITIKSEKRMSNIQICTLSGKSFYSKNDVGTKFQLSKPKDSGIYLLKVVFGDNYISHYKVLF